MSKAGAVLEEVKKAVVGKDEVLVQVLLAILAGGHILLEDIPGVGKTTMALAFSRALALEYNRVQFTPDVLPSDITGFSLYNKRTGAMEYQPGAVLCNLFLADELNRATSRTQSALEESAPYNTHALRPPGLYGILPGPRCTRACTAQPVRRAQATRRAQPAHSAAPARRKSRNNCSKTHRPPPAPARTGPLCAPC